MFVVTWVGGVRGAGSRVPSNGSGLPMTQPGGGFFPGSERNNPGTPRNLGESEKARLENINVQQQYRRIESPGLRDFG